MRRILFGRSTPSNKGFWTDHHCQRTSLNVGISQKLCLIPMPRTADFVHRARWTAPLFKLRQNESVDTLREKEHFKQQCDRHSYIQIHSPKVLMPSEPYSNGLTALGGPTHARKATVSPPKGKVPSTLCNHPFTILCKAISMDPSHMHSVSFSCRPTRLNFCENYRFCFNLRACMCNTTTYHIDIPLPEELPVSLVSSLICPLLSTRYKDA